MLSFLAKSRETTDEISLAARELGESIVKTPEYQNYLRCEAKMKKNDDIRSGVDYLNGLTDELEQQNSKVSDEEVLEAYDSFWDSLDGHSQVEDFLRAREEMVEMMTGIREQLSDKLGVDVTSLLMMTLSEMEDMLAPEDFDREFN